MKTYIKKDIKGYYIEFTEEIDPVYWAGKIGSTYEDFRAGKWILLSEEQAAFHMLYPRANVYQVLNMIYSDPSMRERTLEDAKMEKIRQINEYDNSGEVNSFSVVQNGETIATSWLNPTERANYRSSIDAAKLTGLETVSLYIGELPITLPISTAEVMLAQIQLYADACYIVKKQHEAAVEALDNIEDVDAYDITSDYPQKLVFNL